MDEQRPPISVTFRVLGKESETLTDPHLILLRVLDDYLKNPDMVRRIIADFRAQVLDGSDHSAYRELADAVTDSIIGDPNDWDGDDSELYLLCEYLKNARDIGRHEAAEELREKGREFTATANAALLFAATELDPYQRGAELDPYQRGAELDPYQRGAEGVWLRKSDGTVVSWPIVRD